MNHHESKAFLVLLTFVMSVVFLAVNSEATIKPFPLYKKWEKGVVVSTERVIKTENYVYHLNEYLILLVAFHVIMAESIRFRTFYTCVFLSLCFDTLDYLLTFNTEWFFVGDFPVSANIIIMAFLGTVFILDAWKERSYNRLR